MAEKDQHNRYRCLETGCNPVMKADTPENAKKLGEAHTKATGHRTAKWAIRSPNGKAKARRRNRTGYYDQYNVGYKDASNRPIPGRGYDSGWGGESTLSEWDRSSEGLGQWDD